MVAIWTRKLPAVALFICGVLFCNGKGQLSHENNGALNEITEFNDDTQFPELDPDWITQDDTAALKPLLSPELSWENVPLQYVKRGKSQVFSAGLFGKRSSGWNQGHQNGLFGKRTSDWLDAYLSGDDEADHYSEKREWNNNQKTGMFGKRHSDVEQRTYEDILKSLHDKLMDKRAANVGRVRTKSSGQHVFRSAGLFGKRSAEEPEMEKALWPEDEQRRK